MPQMASQVLLENVWNDIWKSLLRYFLPFSYSFVFCGNTASVTCLCPQLCQWDRVKDIIQDLREEKFFCFMCGSGWKCKCICKWLPPAPPLNDVSWECPKSADTSSGVRLGRNLVFIDLSELKPALGNAVVNFSIFISGGAYWCLLCLKHAMPGGTKTGQSRSSSSVLWNILVVWSSPLAQPLGGRR